MSNQPRLVLVRHGQTEWSERGWHTGTTDIPLTGVGEAQAKALGAALARFHFDLVLSSPLTRASRTAELAGLTPISFDADLVEWDYGDFEGKTTDEIRESYPGWTIWRGPWRGGENSVDVARRADRVIDRLIGAVSGNAAVVAHGHLLRMLTARWVGSNYEAGGWLSLYTATWSVLDWERGSRVIRHWNVEVSPS